MDIVIDVSKVDAQAAHCSVDVHATLDEKMCESSKNARRVEGECIRRVEQEARFVIDLVASMKQADVQRDGIGNTAHTKIANIVAQLDILEKEVTAVCGVKIMLSVLLGDCRATYLMKEAQLFDFAFI